jgi:hypothetical protein
MERIFVSHIVLFLEDEGLLSSGQFGFRIEHSTEDQLLLTYVVNWVHRGLIVGVVFLDFSKSFDIVSHSVLLSKLRLLGFCDQFLAWIRSFLVGGRMRVFVSGALRDFREVRRGVPQGSVLGPILFFVYVNDIVFGVGCYWKTFADDFKLYLSYLRDLRAVQQGVSLLQRDLPHH